MSGAKARGGTGRGVDDLPQNRGGGGKLVKTEEEERHCWLRSSASTSVSRASLPPSGTGCSWVLAGAALMAAGTEVRSKAPAPRAPLGAPGGAGVVTEPRHLGSAGQQTEPTLTIFPVAAPRPPSRPRNTLPEHNDSKRAQVI